MIGNKAIAIIIAVGVGLLAGLGAIYLYQQGNGLSVGGEQQTAATGPSPGTAAPAPEPKVRAEAIGGARPNAEPTAVPSFDVVVVDPNGEGVIAGRAAPGWQVSVQSGGAKVAATTVDAEGQWSAVLDKPLPAGDHALSLKITSPDGTRAVSSQEWVNVEVGDAAKKAATGSGETTSAAGQTPTSGTVGQVAPPQDAIRAVPAGSAERASAPPKPKLKFKTVDYEDTASEIGSVSIAGASDPGATISVYCDDQPLATVRVGADGAWSVVAEKKLGIGQHVFRAERIDAATGKATAEAAVAMERMVPKPPEVVAAREETPQSSATSSPDIMPGSEKEVYTIRRGDTLWAIAKRYLGSGLRYTRIFQDNREVIDDPDLILPKQQVKVPTP
jgi:nucleoid-associated protein YgaU